jgi:hypothetical protein
VFTTAEFSRKHLRTLCGPHGAISVPLEFLKGVFRFCKVHETSRTLKVTCGARQGQEEAREIFIYIYPSLSFGEYNCNSNSLSTPLVKFELPELLPLPAPGDPPGGIILVLFLLGWSFFHSDLGELQESLWNDFRSILGPFWLHLESLLA